MCESLALIDVAKAAIGPFVGAGLAFLTAKVHDYTRARRENISASRLAIATLGEQLADLVNFRDGVFAEIQKKQALLGGNAPRWAYAFPLHYSFNEDAKLDMKPLSFLFESSDSDGLYQLLSNPGRCHVNAQQVAAELRSACERMQEKLEVWTGEDFEKRGTVDEARKAIGQRAGMAVSDLLLTATAAFTEEDELELLTAARTIREATLRRYPGAKSIPRLALEDAHRAAALPALPESFAPGGQRF